MILDFYHQQILENHIFQNGVWMG